MNQSPFSTREFTYPALTKAALLIIIPIMAFALFMSAGTDIVLTLVLTGIMVAVFVAIFLQMTGKIRLEPAGLVLTRPLREEVRLQWQEIASISGNWSDSSVHLKDALGERKISFTLMLNGFQQLIDELFNRRPDLFAVSPGQSFSGGLMRWIQIAFFSSFLVLTMFVMFSSDSSEAPYTALIFLGALFVLVVIFVFFQPVNITFENDLLVVKYVFGTREILRTSVLNVQLTITGGRSRSLRIRLDYNDAAAGKDKHIDFAGFSCGSPRLYGALRSWAGIIETPKFSAYRDNSLF